VAQAADEVAYGHARGGSAQLQAAGLVQQGVPTMHAGQEDGLQPLDPLGATQTLPIQVSPETVQSMHGPLDPPHSASMTPAKHALFVSQQPPGQMQAPPPEPLLDPLLEPVLLSLLSPLLPEEELLEPPGALPSVPPPDASEMTISITLPPHPVVTEEANAIGTHIRPPLLPQSTTQV
jgi:hypothetical protein